MDITREIFPGRMQNKMGNAIRQTDKLQEIRIRVNTPIMLRSDGIEYFVSENGKITRRKEMAEKVQKRDIEDIISHICRSSPYAFEEEIKRGYLTIEGGHRVGITGQAVLDCSGDIKTMKNISFLNIRIAHEVIGVSKEVIKDIFIGGMLQNTLIISPPGFGKTTLLRDLVREVSNGNTYGSGLQCCIIDERSELAGCFRGIPQLDVGCRTDVLDGCPKAVGMMMAVRSMAPQVIAVDELGTMEDIHALFSLIRSGCRILATIHGDGISELKTGSGGWEFIKSGLTSAWEGIKSVSGTVWNGIKSTVSSAWDGIKSVSSSAWESIKSDVSSAWESIKSKTLETWSSLKEGIGSAWENIKSSTQTAASSVKDTISNVWSGLKDFTHQTWSGIKDTVTNIATNVKDFVQNTWSSIKDNTSQAMSHMKDRIVEGWNAIKSNTESLWGNIKDKVVSIAGDMKEKFATTIHNVAENFTNNLNTMKEKTSSGLQSIASTVGSKLSEIKSNVTSGLSNLVSSVASGMSNMVSTIKEKVSGIGQAFMDIAKSAFTWGKDIISNLLSGIGSMIGSLVDKVRNVASTIKDYLGFSEPEKGPLSNFHTYMPDMIDLMGKGIEGNLGKLKGPMSDLASAIIPGTKGTVAMQNQNGGGQGTDISGLTAMLSKYLPQMANRQIVLDSGILVGELTDGINRQLGKAYV